jgi:hypothetical protein
VEKLLFLLYINMMSSKQKQIFLEASNFKKHDGPGEGRAEGYISGVTKQKTGNTRLYTAET